MQTIRIPADALDTVLTKLSCILIAKSEKGHKSVKILRISLKFFSGRLHTDSKLYTK